MEIGTGIFSASIVVASVLLFGFTKDRWPWKRIIQRAILGFLLLITFCFLFYWGYAKYTERVVLKNEYLSIALGDKATDVKFKIGEPARKSNEIWMFNNSYNNNPESLIIFGDSGVMAVLYVGNGTYENKISGLGIDSKYNELVEKLGNPSSVTTSIDDLERIMSFKDWNLVFKLRQNKVTAFGIYDPKQGELDFQEDPEKVVLKQESKD